MSRNVLVIVCLVFILSIAFPAQAAPPTAFSKISPPNGSSNVGTNVTFQWESKGGSARYCLVPGVTTACPNGEAGYTAVSGSSVALDLQPSTTYSWQVRTYNGTEFTPANGTGGWWTFTTMPMVSKSAPANGTRVSSTTVTLTWGSYPAGSSARYCLSGINGQCTNGAAGYTTAPAGATSAVVTVLAGVTTYWQVRIYDPTGNFTPANGTANWWSFTTPLAPSATFTPTRTPTQTVTPRPTETEVGGLNPDPGSRTPTPRPTQKPAKTATPTRTSTITPTSTPLPPVAVAPKGTILPGTLKPVFKWTPVAGASSYVLRVFIQGRSTTTPFVTRTLDQSGCTTECSFAFDTTFDFPVKSWTNGRTYLWDVAAVYPAGQGPFTSRVEFVMYVLPSRPELRSPIDNATVSPTPEFVWISKAGSTTYQITVYSSVMVDSLKFKYNVTRDITNDVRCEPIVDTSSRQCRYQLLTPPLADVITALQFGWYVTEGNVVGKVDSAKGFFKVQVQN